MLGDTEGTMGPMNVYTKQQRIAEHARLMPDKQLREFLRKRVRDGVLLRIIGKWLKCYPLPRPRIVHSYV